ncbi:dynein intermediate chain, putative [Plasmodium gallinaceum]|uniref:Dynein intermediate chain, putative n=1 Tax=Plasmodium gallinaceum TaxID=5849 RepID=A0A1J1GYS2_PLAGA|nr:dynein intermediate chain, putative [Plasmodium gallinaceum]CRG97385.1 dynein intermediate chain, putative [Plasmodium gallinaceum]
MIIKERNNTYIERKEKVKHQKKKKEKEKKENEKLENKKKDNIKKKNDMKKKNEIDIKNKNEVDIKNKSDTDTKNKNEKEYDEKKKKIENDIKGKNENNEKKNHILKNTTLIDTYIINEDPKKLGDEKIHHKNFNSLIRVVNIELEKNIKNIIGIDFCDELSSIIFKNFHSVVIKKNYLFSLFQKYMGTDELIIINNSLTDYKIDDLLIFRNTQKYYKKNYALVVDEKIFSYFIKKDKNAEINLDESKNKNNSIVGSNKKEELNCIFIKPKEYISLNEEEIENEIRLTNIIENRKKFKKYIYINKKKKLFIKPEFMEKDEFISIKNNITPNSVLKEKTLDFFSKNSIILQSKGCQTYQTIYKSLGTQYNIEFLKKKKEEILKSNKLHKFLCKFFPIIEKSIIENLILSQKEEQKNKQSNDISPFKNIKYLNKIFIYTDVKYTTDKVVLFTFYLSLINYLIFIIYVNNYKNNNFIEGVNTDSYILVWCYNNYINPLYALISPYQISSVAVNEKDYNLVIAGCSNGLLVIWKLPENFYGKSILDSKINEKTIDVEPYLFSSIEQSHKREVTSLIFLKDKNLIIYEKKISFSYQKNYHLLVSISVDGTILIWDVTNIEIIEVKNNMKKKEKELTDELYSFKPIFKITTTRPNTEYSLGFTYLHFIEINQNVSSFFAFSEEGEYIIGNLYGCMQKEKNYSIINKINDDYKNYKTLLCVKRNNILKYLILTLTDTNFYLWKENEEHPLYISPKSNEIYSCCEFSQTKISVIFIGKINGQIEIWNLLDQKNHYIYSLTISSYSLTCISIFQNYDSTLFKSLEKKTKPVKIDDIDIIYENCDEIIDTNEYLMSKNEDDIFKYAYNKIIIGDSSGCVFVYEIEENLLNSSKEEIREFSLWIENRIYVNKQKLKRQLELFEEKEKMLMKDEKKTNERKEQLKTKLEEDYKNILEKYKSYLLGQKI